MKEFREAASAEAASLSGTQQLAFVRMIGALASVLESFVHDIADIKIHVGTLRGDLTSMTARELTERLDPIAEDIAAITGQLTALEGRMVELEQDARAGLARASGEPLTDREGG